MSSISRFLYLFLGIVVFVLSGWLTVVAVSTLETSPDYTVLGVPIDAWIGTLGSISASGIFFSVSEALRWTFDANVSRNYERLHFYEHVVGIRDYFSQKGSDDAREDYRKAIAAARHRVWAFGISNGEFITEHLAGLIAKKKRTPAFDVCICFVDPDTKITNTQLQVPCDLTQVWLFDITRDAGSADNSSRVRKRVTSAVDQIAASHVDIAIKFVSTAGYVSAMVVDDVIYVFPFTALSTDNTRTPYLKLVATSQMGQRFLSFFENIKDHSLLSRSAQ